MLKLRLSIYCKSVAGKREKKNTSDACDSSMQLTSLYFIFSDCQYTCHHQCLPLIQLECKSISHDPMEDEGAVLTGETNISDLSISNQSTEPLSEPATVSSSSRNYYSPPPKKTHTKNNPNPLHSYLFVVRLTAVAFSLS